MSNQEEVDVEKIYQKKTLLEQILLRPDTYIGSVEIFQQFLWVYEKTTDSMVYRRVQYVPGLFKIFGISQYDLHFHR